MALNLLGENVLICLRTVIRRTDRNICNKNKCDY